MVKKKNSDVNPFSHGENAEVWLEAHADRIPDLVSTASAAAATIGVGNNATFGSATVIGYVAYQISVPANASLIVVDKTTDLYITENQSVGVTSGTGSALTYTAIFEAIT
jgi:hypothetical protein